MDANYINLLIIQNSLCIALAKNVALSLEITDLPSAIELLNKATNETVGSNFKDKNLMLLKVYAMALDIPKIKNCRNNELYIIDLIRDATNKINISIEREM